MGTKAHRRARGHALAEDEEAVQDAGVDVEESANGPSVPAEARFDDSGFADFAIAGARVRGEFRCADCGYGAVVQRALPPCPMCGGTVWESRGPRFLG
jgi:rubrerythrin